MQHMGDMKPPRGASSRHIPQHLSDAADAIRASGQEPTRPCQVTDCSSHRPAFSRRMMSTSMIPPQRRDWWTEEVRRKERKTLVIACRDLGSHCGKWRGLSDRKWRNGRESIRRDFMTERVEFQRRHTEAMMDHGRWDPGWDDDV